MFNNFELNKDKFRTFAKFSFIALAIVSLVYACVTNNQSICESVEVNIKNQSKNPLLNNKDVLYLATNRGADMLLNKRLKEINLKEIEKRVLTNTLVKDCQVAAGLNNKLNIDLVLQEPIARFAESNQSKSFYINDEGKFLQLSKNFSPRVLIVSGGYFRNKKNLTDQYYGNDVIKFLNRIKNDKFWNAQVAEINIDSARNITIIPLVGNHIAELGRPINIESKLQKLQLFHQKIMLDDSYKSFKKVNVQYKSQIICE